MMNTEYAEQCLLEYKTAEELLNVAMVNNQFGFYNSTVNRLYYACFHAVNAMLLSIGIENYKSHDGAKILFGQHLVKTGLVDKEWGRFFTTIMQYRNDSDYDVYTHYTAEDVANIMPKCQQFVSMAKSFIDRE